MHPNDYPTKANLLKAQQEIKLIRQGHVLLDKKQQVLLAAYLKEEAYINKLRAEVSTVVNAAYGFLGEAHMEFGHKQVSQIADPTVLTATTASTDAAFFAWTEAKMLLVQLAEKEATLFNLSKSIQKTQKKAAALEKILIPKQEARIKYIQAQLEERGRDEIIRLKKRNVMLYC